MTCLLCFLCGSLVSAICFFLYCLWMEDKNQCLNAATRNRAYNEGYAKGYEDRAMLAASATGELKQVN